MPAPLSPEQLGAFARDGFLHVPGLVPEGELAAPDRDSLDLIERGVAGPFGDKRWRYQEDAEFGKEPSAGEASPTADAQGSAGNSPIAGGVLPWEHCLYRVNDLAAADMPRSFQVLLAYPRLLAAIHQLVDGDEFAASVHALVFKLPRHGAPARWHQDPVKVFRFPVFNVDIYLDDATTDNACLRAFPGSHLAGHHDPAESPGFIESWTNGGDEASASGAVAISAKRGDVIFHATTLVHGSPWNRSEALRRTIYFHIDHRRDVELACDRWPQRQFAEARKVTARAIATRA